MQHLCSIWLVSLFARYAVKKIKNIPYVIYIGLLFISQFIQKMSLNLTVVISLSRCRIFLKHYLGDPILMTPKY